MVVKKLLEISEVPAGSERSFGSIEVKNARTVTVTVRLTYNASATSGATINLYFVPEKGRRDTIPYAYFDVDFTAGAVVQKTALVDPPEDGQLIITIKNNDSTYSITNAECYVTVGYWTEK